MENFTLTKTADNLTVVQQIYNLPELEFKKLYNQSAAVDGLGFFYFIYMCVSSLGLLLPVILFFSRSSSNTHEPQSITFTVFVGIVGILYFLYTLSLSNLLNEQRSFSAARSLRTISFLYAILMALSTIVYCFAAINMPILLVAATIPLIFFILFFTTFHAVKNPLLFNDGSPSHKQIKYVRQCRKNGIFDPTALPKTREPKKLDAFFRTYAYVGTILFFILSVLGFFGAVTQAIIEEINNSSDPQGYVQKADQAMEKKNFGDAFKLYEKAAKQNLPEGIFNLGICYAEGIGCDEDFAKAYECFNHPDVKEAPLAKFYIGIMHYSGQGAPQDFQKAAELLKSAADSGVEAAQKFLGYQNGKMPDYDVPLAKLLKENFKQNEKN